LNIIPKDLIIFINDFNRDFKCQLFDLKKRFQLIETFDYDKLGHVHFSFFLINRAAINSLL